MANFDSPFQYLSGSMNSNSSTLVKVISAVLKFTPQQTQVVLEKENHRHTLVSCTLPILGYTPFSNPITFIAFPAGTDQQNNLAGGLVLAEHSRWRRRISPAVLLDTYKWQWNIEGGLSEVNKEEEEEEKKQQPQIITMRCA